MARTRAFIDQKSQAADPYPHTVRTDNEDKDRPLAVEQLLDQARLSPP